MSYLGYNKRSGGSAKLKMEVAQGVVQEVDLKDVVFKNGGFEFPEYEQGGAPVNFNFIIGGWDWQTPQEAQDYLNNFNNAPNHFFKDVVCNALDTTQEGLKRLSLYNFTRNYLSTNDLYRTFHGDRLTHFYDVKGYIKALTSTSNISGNNVKVLSFPGVENFNAPALLSQSYATMPALEHLHMPNLKTIGPDELDNTDYLNHAPENMAFTVSQYMQSSNNGALEGDLQWLIDNKFTNVIFV